ncbi:hypothetical protein [Bradyrhizobium sp. ORS 285]|uniref:hypothetical protein n=1 Tax=Bradyrhizobium sp. ORS 285 TaxID=115808 RepID=UPI000311BC8F|nr:hypothetical protein [Bradyrhizobium sp. ORS 285]
MTTGQIYALSMPLVVAAMVAVYALLLRRPWAETAARQPLHPSPSRRDGVRDGLVDHIERLNAEIEGKAHLVRQELRQLKNTR